MFIDHERVVALEYIFFQGSSEEEDGKSNYQLARLHGEYEDAEEHMLGAEKY